MTHCPTSASHQGWEASNIAWFLCQHVKTYRMLSINPMLLHVYTGKWTPPPISNVRLDIHDCRTRKGDQQHLSIPQPASFFFRSSKASVACNVIWALREEMTADLTG